MDSVDMAKRNWPALLAIAMIATIGVLANFWCSFLWVIFVMACSLVFPVRDLCAVQKAEGNEKNWERGLKAPSCASLKQWEYQEASADWRHRDGLTWQMPTVVVSLVGLVMSQIYDKAFKPEPEWIKVAILVMFASMSGGLVVTLKQNLFLQDHSRKIIVSISGSTKRFGFDRVGSHSLYRLMFLVWLLLTLGATVECLKLLVRTWSVSLLLHPGATVGFSNLLGLI